MTRNLLFYAGILAISATACNSDDDNRYIDLNTGESIELKKDSTTGLMVNAETGKPVKIYVDRDTKDTIWGASGTVINGKLSKSDDGDWTYKSEDGDTKVQSENGETKIKDGEYKKEVEKDD